MEEKVRDVRWVVTGFLSTLFALVVAGGLFWWLNSHPSGRLASQPNIRPGLVDNSQTQAAPQSPPAPSPPPVETPPSITISDIPVLSVGSSGTAVTRVQQLLAELGYLPVQWSPSIPEQVTMTDQLNYTQSPPAGGWHYRFASTPAHLQSLWKPGVYNVLTEGAVMAFQQVNHMDTDGVAGPQVWSALLQAKMQNQHDPYAYSYVSVTMGQPEKLTIWSNGRIVLTTLVNTGISASPTVTGTHPVYIQYRTQTMSGVDPSGQHYSDPGVPWVSYFYGGEAVHGFVRASYGYPQSLGCVELPLQKAAEAWNYMHLGTLVTVS